MTAAKLFRVVLTVAIVLAVIVTVPSLRRAGAEAPKLSLLEIGTDSTSFDVIATAVVGKTELILWDALMKPADGTRLADALAGTGKRVKAIILSHPDHDHYGGVPVLLERFPGTPVYMTAAAIEWFNKTPQHPAFTPQLLPDTHLTVDGEKIEIIPDLTGDVIKPTNSMLWIPSMRTLMVGDIVFDGIHPWLGSSDVASRKEWLKSLDRIDAMKPLALVPGHKRDVNSPDTPASVQKMRRYLIDFDSLAAASSDAPTLAAAVLAKYPDLAVRVLVRPGAWEAKRPKKAEN